MIVAGSFHVIATLGCAVWLSESPIILVHQSLKVSSTLTADGICDLASLLKSLGMTDVVTVSHLGYGMGGGLLLLISLWKCKDGLLLLRPSRFLPT